MAGDGPAGRRPPRSRLGEHSGRYEHVGDQLAGAGLETFASDFRGNGASGGERTWLDRWSQLHDDLEDQLAAARAALPGRSVILYGHSMGGLIALGYVLADRPQPDLDVLSAPASTTTWRPGSTR